MSNYFNVHEFDCWITGARVQPSEKRILNFSEKRAMWLLRQGLDYSQIATRMKVNVASVRGYINGYKSKKP